MVKAPAANLKPEPSDAGLNGVAIAMPIIRLKN